MLLRIILSFFVSAALLSCSGTSNFDREDAVGSITLEGFEKYIRVLASDEFQGRKPFTEGERKTIRYLEEQFKELGLEAGNGESYLQEVPMIEITTNADSVMKVTSPTGSFSLRGFHEYTLNTERPVDSFVWNDEELVFAGFGVVAPEYNWNDYAGLDVKGKIVLVLVNDPGFGGSDSAFFKGNTMTYYGRWTYKFEEAARQGAKGCFVIHNTVPAGYPFAVLQNSWDASHLYLDERGKDIYHCEGIGWVTRDAAEKLFKAAGMDFNEQQSAARQAGFKGKPMNLKFSTSARVKYRYDKSYNVIGKITGTEKPGEYVVYSAHWDHLGIGKADAKGDSIYNGALDNASGTAGLLEIAKAFKAMKSPPARTVVFLAVTAEEQGLWGSAYYAQNPVYPKEKTVANINMDGVNPFGRMKDVMVIGKGQSELEDFLQEEAASSGRDVVADAEPEKGLYFRSDHFHFARIGVPALYIHAGNNLIGKGTEAGQELKEQYTRKYYHQPSDDLASGEMNFEGGIDDLKLLFQVGKRLANTDVWPKWKETSEFRAVRESYIKK